MTESIESNSKRNRKQPSRTLVLIGCPLVLATIVLAARTVWEETFLTLREGPQMLSFALAHGVGAVLFLAPLLLSIWLLVALIAAVICLWCKTARSKWYWSTLASAILTLGFLSLPASFWQWMFIGAFAAARTPLISWFMKLRWVTSERVAAIWTMVCRSQQEIMRVHGGLHGSRWGKLTHDRDALLKGH